MTTMLEVSNLSAGYGQLSVLDNISLKVDEGEIAVILGSNGAGKTTTMRAISGVIARTGSITFQGSRIDTSSADSIVRGGIAQVPQGRGTFPELTVLDNLRAGAYIRKDKEIAADIEKWFGLFPRLEERKDQRAGSLSGGEQQMVAISRALMSRPKLLLCDEPSLGLAPLIIQEMFDTIATLNRDSGLSVLLVEQNAHMAMKIAKSVYLIETGRIVASGPAADIANDDSIRKAYLGF
jgi:branched-chain amino acid transport system ATP-binding protein